MCKQVGRVVSSAQLGMSNSDWDTSLELEAFLEYPFKIKETVEYKSYLTGAQAYILFWDLKEGCDDSQPLSIKLHPPTPRMLDRDRKVEVRQSHELTVETVVARKTMQSELSQRFFKDAERPSKVTPPLHAYCMPCPQPPLTPPPPPPLRRGWCRCS